MKLPDFDFVQTAGVRRAVVPEGDIRGDIAFQNDINVLLARLDGGNPPLQALGWVREAVTAPRVRAAEPAFRLIQGGGMRGRTIVGVSLLTAQARRA